MEDICYCELEYFPLLKQYKTHGCRILDEMGSRRVGAKIICCVKFPNQKETVNLGYISVDVALAEKLPVEHLSRLLAEDFSSFVYTYAGNEEEMIEDLLRRGVNNESAIANDVAIAFPRNQPRRFKVCAYDTEGQIRLRRFCYENDPISAVKSYYELWNPFLKAFVSDNVVPPSLLSFTKRYADRQSPPMSANIDDWRAFELQPPERNLIVVSEVIGSCRQFVAYSPKRLASDIVQCLQESYTFCEVFRESLDITCLPFDLDIDGAVWRQYGGDDEEVYIDRVVQELRLRMTTALRSCMNENRDNFSLMEWPVRVFRGDSDKKMSLHVYQTLPNNITVRNIDEVGSIVSGMLENVRRSRGMESTLLGVWRSGDFESRPEDGHRRFYEPAGNAISGKTPELNDFVSFVDVGIYRTNRSLRLPGCAKSRQGRVMTAWLDGTMRRVTENDVIGALAHYPHETPSYGCVRQILRSNENKRTVSISAEFHHIAPIMLNALKKFIENELDVRITRRKITISGAFFDTDEKRCVFTKRSHGAAKQYFYFQPVKNVLLRKCWHGACQSKFIVVGQFRGDSLHVVSSQK